MNDWWNDPPEQDEPPECPSPGCDGCGEPHDGVFICDVCGIRWPLPQEPEPDQADFFSDSDFAQSFTVPPAPERCPHGRPWDDCSDCDHAADLAYDAARERRSFR